MKSDGTTVGGLVFILAFLTLVITYNYVVGLADTVAEFSGYFFAVFVLPLVGFLTLSFIVIQTIAKTLNRKQKAIIMAFPSVAVLSFTVGFHLLFYYIGKF